MKKSRVSLVRAHSRGRSLHREFFAPAPKVLAGAPAPKIRRFAADVESPSSRRPVPPLQPPSAVMKKRLILLFACSLTLALCLWGRSSFYPGAALFVLRWPLAFLGFVLAFSFLWSRRWPLAVISLLLPVVAGGEWLASWSQRARPAAILDPTRPLT